MLYPLTFQPIFKERVWGGRNLERLYHKSLPPGVPVGESWEIVDRPGDVSTIADGPLRGRDLHWLMENQRRELLGPLASTANRFPLLLKILDAQETLSLQVHPPAAVAARFGGEPKTEMWYIADAGPGAELFAGLRRGVTRAEFERKIHDTTVAECFHRLAVKPGDALFLPSGRVHAIGAGNVIFEIQQNSDTTYRVFDWNRAGLDGKPRTLHVEQALASIDFDDVEPSLIRSRYSAGAAIKVRFIVQDALFVVDAVKVRRGERYYLRIESPQILGVLRGRLRVGHEQTGAELAAGDFCLLPACLGRVTLRAEMAVEYLHIQLG